MSLSDVKVGLSEGAAITPGRLRYASVQSADGTAAGQADGSSLLGARNGRGLGSNLADAVQSRATLLGRACLCLCPPWSIFVSASLNRHFPQSHRSLFYRPDIDGLRAAAIVAVVLFHAFPSLIPGGFVGVDIFFVISGYLIAGIIFEEIHRGTFQMYGFYRRRVLRLSRPLP